MYTPAQYWNTRREIRFLRQENARLQRVHLYQKQKAEQTEKVIREQDKLINELEQENERLKKREHELLEQLEKTKQERDTYKGMLFKPEMKSSIVTLERKRGGKIGHRGYGRRIPETINRHIRAFLTHCPDCNTPLSRTDSIDTHTVSDIPHWKDMQPVTTQYFIERQWCKTCKGEVHATPIGVIPGARLGINLVTMITVWRYRFREPLNKIAERLLTHYSLKISEGTLISIFSRTRGWLGPYYDEFLEEIRGSPVKHADETGWRVGGGNWWCWIFSTKKSTVYTIEESRGGGIPRKILKGAAGTLVRDDYKGYVSIPLPQQSCWSHPIRIAKDAAEKENASEEMQLLHKKLKTLFELLAEDIAQPFNRKQRMLWYGWYKEDIEKIIHTPYSAADAKKLQTRIKNQNTNLLTALLYQGVPLTNNQAERDLRTMVVTRKISGGSQSEQGAKTHAVNLSVVETICKRKLPLLDTLQSHLITGATGKY